MKKNLILQTSISILADRGYSNTTTRMISEKANIAVGSIYTHFKNKESIVDYIFQTEYDKRAKYLGSLEDYSGPQIDKFNLFLDFHFNELTKNKALATVLVRESTNPELQHLEGISNFTSQLSDFFKTILDKGLEAGEIRNLDTSLTSEIIFSTIRGNVFNISSKMDTLLLDDVKQELKDFINFAIKKN